MQFCSKSRILLLFCLFLITIHIGIYGNNYKIDDNEFQNFDNKIDLANYLNKSGLNYWQQGNTNKAIEYFQKSIDINEKLENKNALKSLNNYIGLIYFDLAQFDSALFYLKKAVALSRQYKNKSEVCEDLINIALCYQGKTEYTESNKELLSALEVAKEINDLNKIKSCYSILAENYEKLKMPDKSFEYFTLAASISKHLQDQQIKTYEYRTREAEAAKLEKEKALRSASDTIQEVLALTNEKQFKIDSLNHEKDLQTIIIREQEAKTKALEAKKRSAKLTIITLIGCLFLVLLFMFILFRQFNEKKKTNKLLAEQNAEIQKQKQEIERHDEIVKHQSKKITSSINYARHIQSAILPPNSLISKVLPEHFIVYKPKDIVSGDFYWMTEKEGVIIIAAVDCTGHGVPGAFMSMLGIAFLNEIVNKIAVNKHIRTLKANEILNQLREQVIHSLHQSGKLEENKDGMDLALCIIDIENKHMQYSGAHNPLIMVRNNEMMQFDADKMSVSYSSKLLIPFTNYDITIQLGDIIYLFSDGFMDQISASNVKFMSKNFKNLLLSIHQKPMNEQKQILEQIYEDYKGQKEQVDDVLILGIKITEYIKQASLKPRKNWETKRILIAEDTDLNYFLLVEALKPTKAQVFRAKNGLETIELCKSQEVDLILMDINMPVMNGLDATLEIRKFKKNLPIIAQTAQSQVDDEFQCRNAGCDDYISKPIDLAIFLEKIENLL